MKIYEGLLMVINGFKRILRIIKVPYGGFHKWGIPKMVGLNGKIKVDDLGVPPFQETSICIHDVHPNKRNNLELNL